MTDMPSLGPYEIRGELGRGAMAVVWRGWDPKLVREVAVKEPVIPHGTSPAVADELASRFIREGRAAAALSHPGIVTIFGADTYDGRPAIVMELIDGQPLSAVLEAGALSRSAALGIASQLLEAVAYAHAKGVVHRDIKPDNVFITADGRVKLTDFGIAHVGSGTALTQAGTVMGTPGYMAPEQVTGQPTDARADLFAIGVVLYECLTGVNPFLAGDAHPTTVMYRVLNEPLPDIRTTLRSAPESLAATIAVATAKDAVQRFASAEDMRRALLGEVAIAMPKAPRTADGKRTALLVAAGVLAVAIVGVLVASILPEPVVGGATEGGISGAASVADGGSDAAGPDASTEQAPATRDQSGAVGSAVQGYVAAVNDGRLDEAYMMRSDGFRAQNSDLDSSSGLDEWYTDGWALDLGDYDISVSGSDTAFVSATVLGYENRFDPYLSTHLSGMVFELKYEAGSWKIASVNASDG